MSDSERARANLLAIVAALAELPGGHHGDGWLRWRTDVPHPWFTGVLCQRSATAGDAAFVTETVASLTAAGGAWTWWLGPEAEGWEPLLKDAGLSASEGSPEMAVQLGELLWSDPLPDGLTITYPATAEERRVWVETVIAGFGIPPEAIAPFVDVVEALKDILPMRYLLGWLDGRPVATVGVIEAAGAAGVYYVATLPEARRRGIAAALTREALRAARDSGVTVGILQASSMGQPVYERLGFRVVGQVTPYAPTPS